MKYTKDEMETMFANGYKAGASAGFSGVIGGIAVLCLIIIICFIVL